MFATTKDATKAPNSQMQHKIAPVLTCAFGEVLAPKYTNAIAETHGWRNRSMFSQSALGNRIKKSSSIDLWNVWKITK